MIFVCLFCNRGDTYYSITAGSRQGSLAKPLSLLFLTPRPVISSHQHRTLVCLFWSENLHTLLTHQQIPLLLANLSCRMYPTAQIAFSPTPSHPLFFFYLSANNLHVFWKIFPPFSSATNLMKSTVNNDKKPCFERRKTALKMHNFYSRVY